MWFNRHRIHNNTGNHVVFIHTKCQSKFEDFYLADMIFALLRMSRFITICTTYIDPNSPLNYIEDPENNLQIMLPCGNLSSVIRTCCMDLLMDNLKMMSLIFQLILTPPTPEPSVIITDTDALAISLLKTFSSYRVIYIKHFPDLYSANTFEPTITVHFKRSTARSLSRADEIIVQTQCLKEVFKRSLPTYRNKITVINACYDTGFWLHTPPDMSKVAPTLPECTYILYVVFVEYKPRCNIELILSALERLNYRLGDPIVFNTHVVFAGYSDSLDNEEQSYFHNLGFTTTTFGRYKDNIIFLPKTNILQQKALLYKCTAVLNPTNFNVYPGPILMAMNLKKPIVSVNNGFAASVLENEVSAFLIADDPADFASMMYKLAENCDIAEDLVETAKSEFDEKFSYDVYRHRVNSMIIRQIDRDY